MAQMKPNKRLTMRGEKLDVTGDSACAPYEKYKAFGSSGIDNERIRLRVLSCCTIQ